MLNHINYTYYLFNFVNFCESSTIHGISFLEFSKINSSESIQVPIEQAPYPSVTICPLESTPFGSIENIVDENYQGNVQIQNIANNDSNFFKNDVLQAITTDNSKFEESILDNENDCKKIYSYSKDLLRIKKLDLLNNNNVNMKIGTLLSWLYNHVDDLNDDQFSFGMKEKILEVLKPSQIPEVSSRRRFETSEDIFLPDLAQSLIGKHSSESKKDLNIQGIKYTEDLYYMMKYSKISNGSVPKLRENQSKPGIPFCLFANSNEKGKKIDEYPEKILQKYATHNIQGVGHKKGLTLLVDSQMIKNRARKAVSDYEGFKVIVTVPGAIAAKVSFIVEPDFPGEHSFYLHGIHYITASPDVIDWNKDANECKLKKISNQCNCSPWFINQTGLSICNEQGMSCFNDKASNYQDDLKDRTECDCKNDCEMVHFFYSMRQEGYNREWFNPKNKDAFLNNYPHGSKQDIPGAIYS
ncbi:unnamed protein product [Lepeophtheirus salmonis]|uniref:(salmon louse) hypothetical protein n=1 Tax=Lepeophtheirus salmonis TaxID=72036 RepID=A0A7R8CLL5_LEPSM|nr:unnamed protein product [Lepeophtheirus salmonis]CAF2859620.1 unnamed protein product [Lepeophtheirus salmonis]